LLACLRTALALPSGKQRQAAVQRLAAELLAAFGLAGWSFGFNRRKRSLGVCFYHRLSIELSAYLVERNGPEDVCDTLLHEFAHALVGPGHGHDAVWQRKCVEIGARPVRCGQADMPEGNWRAQCASCGAGFHRYRQPKRHKGWFCRRCGPERGSLVWALER
jgi:predicted SprT family Zn-dependent metalloprotease